MGGITTGIGLFSGLDTQSLIQQLLQVEARPLTLMQRRVAQLQGTQAAFLDLNSRLNDLQAAARSFRLDDVFDTKRATSSNPDALSASASGAAQPGSFSFVVDRLVSTQQMLSRGFSDKDQSGLNAGSFTIESDKARLERDRVLADLNGGAGVQRGKIAIDTGSGAVTIDLSRAVTVQDVIDEINATDSLGVQATVDGQGIVLSSAVGSFTVSNVGGSTTASDLGIAGTSADDGGTQRLQGQSIVVLGAGTSLNSLNDGNGVFVSDTVGQNRFDFTIQVDPDGVASSGDEQDVKVNIGPVFDTDGTQTQAAPTSLGGVLDRINDALDDAGVTDLSARISDESTGGDGSRVELVNAGGATVRISENQSGTTARDLGLRPGEDLTGGVIAGRRLIAGLNGTLAHNLNGGSGIAGDGAIDVTTRDGQSFTLNLDLASIETTAELIDRINTDPGNAGRITASLNDAGTGLLIADATGGTSGNLVISGQTAESLGIATEPGGVSESQVRGQSLQLAYVAQATELASLNDGRGVGAGTIRVTDGSGSSTTINIDQDARTVGQLLREINSALGVAGVDVNFRINDQGDGIIAEQEGTGTSPISIEDETGSVARNLRIAGTAEDAGANNFLDGSAERVIEFDPSDSLDDIAQKLNDADAGITATIINDGNGTSPFRLSLTSDGSGSAGRRVLDTGGFDLGLTTLDRGEDAVVFFGSKDPAKGVLLTSSSNTLDGVVAGVNIDLAATSSEPIELTISRDTEAVESAVQELVDAFNGVIDRVAFQTRFDAESGARGALLGDSTALGVQRAVLRIAQGPARGLDGAFSRLAQVGVTVGSGGKLELDAERLREALEQDPQAVEDLFSARVEDDPVDQDDGLPDGVSVSGGGPADDQFSVLGIAGLFEELAEQYTDSIDGILTAERDSVDNQIDLQNDRIEAFNLTLDAKRAQLEAQFLAMERAIGQLQSQQSALAGLNPLLGF